VRQYKIIYWEGKPCLVHMPCGTSWPLIEGATLDQVMDTVIGHDCPNPSSPKGRIIAAARQQLHDQIHLGQSS